MSEGRQAQTSRLLSPTALASVLDSDDGNKDAPALHPGLANLGVSTIDPVSSTRAGKSRAQKRKKRLKPWKPPNKMINVLDNLARGISRPPVSASGPSARLQAISLGKLKKESFALPAASPAAKRPKNCRVCGKNHPEVFHKCPHLQSIQQRQAKLPRTCCTKCIGPTNVAGKCTKGSKCHIIIAKKGAQYNLLCNVHCLTHFRICVQCPPRETASVVKDQQISMLRFRATTVPEPDQFCQESGDQDDADVILRLERIT